jgi:alkanesulfonate monooxygenase SsuD/methylene tetrahydromethanopterin reductase-like flavin-dependent oxidoreductase (luciferase family)
VCVRDSEAELRAVDEDRRASAPWREPFESWMEGNLVGTPEQVCERIRQYQAMGCTYLVPWCADYPEDTSLRMFAERVMPEFR